MYYCLDEGSGWGNPELIEPREVEFTDDLDIDVKVEEMLRWKKILKWRKC